MLCSFCLNCDDSSLSCKAQSFASNSFHSKTVKREMKLKTSGMRKAEKSSVEQHYYNIKSAHQNKKKCVFSSYFVVLYPYSFKLKQLHKQPSSVPCIMSLQKPLVVEKEDQLAKSHVCAYNLLFCSWWQLPIETLSLNDSRLFLPPSLRHPRLLRDHHSIQAQRKWGTLLRGVVCLTGMIAERRRTHAHRQWQQATDASQSVAEVFMIEDSFLSLSGT